ncbi:SGNH/GDSL hydrolase family protein [Streptomyces sp. NPDC101733]|uniref:SGNH/GDSL hydrolase family protein n=1 Tax=unclassified Streptomyces TaxID=2593676 RepID=UPI00382C959F
MTTFRARLAMLGPVAALTAATLAPVQLAGAQPAAAADREWVALGDSHTAGVIKAAGDTFEVPRDGCERTDQSYPQAIDGDLHSLFDLKNVSCGAATINDITFRAQEPIGHNLPGRPDPDHPFPAVPPQSEAVGEGTDVITVGEGGNTLGFADILFQCMSLGGETGGEGTPCKDALAAGIPGRLAKVSDDYDEMLTVLHERAPHAKILSVGYPTVIPRDTSTCEYGNLEQFATITRGDLGWLRTDVLEALDKTIEKSAGALDAARFVNLYDSSRNHSVCDSRTWVEGITARSGDLALVHPNYLGHRNAADQVAAAMLDTLDG